MRIYTARRTVVGPDPQTQKSLHSSILEQEWKFGPQSLSKRRLRNVANCFGKGSYRTLSRRSGCSLRPIHLRGLQRPLFIASLPRREVRWKKSDGFECRMLFTAPTTHHDAGVYQACVGKTSVQ